MPLDDGGRLDQHHRVQTARPQSVEPDPEQAVDRKQSGPTRPLAAKNVQLMTEGEVLQFHNRPATESAGENRRRWNARCLSMPSDTMAANPKTLDFSLASEFLVGRACASSSTGSTTGP